jgi:signal transduction histidine kinase
LAIVREIAVAYGGTVHVDDDDGADGGGARFTVRFPS